MAREVKIMKIDFVVRSDFWRKPGGDTSQINHYVRGLSDFGYECEIRQLRPEMVFARGSIVHVVNTARPFDIVQAAQLAAGHLLVVSPIHHSLYDVSRMRRLGDFRGVQGLIDRHASEANREFLAAVARRTSASEGRRPHRRQLFVNLGRRKAIWSHLGHILNAASAVHVLSWTERAVLMNDTGWDGTNFVRIPNGVEFEVPSLRAEREAVTLVVGRIEPRKRQLEVARAAADNNVRVEFLGGLNENYRRYGRDFQQVVEHNDCLVWSGQVSSSEVQAKMISSDAVLNASWVEVQSLVDIEARRAGCRLLVTPTGSTVEYLDCEVFAHDDIERMVIASGQRVPVEMSGRNYEATWTSVAQQMDRLYRNVS